MDAETNEATGDDWLYTVPQALEALRISRSHFFKLRRQGVITTIKLGHRTAVPRREISRLIAQATAVAC